MDDWRWTGKDVAWVLRIGAQGGVTLALPVLVGIALGYWLDRWLSLAFPWFTLILTVIGAVLGPAILYRWVVSTVARKVQERIGERNRDEEGPEDRQLQGDA